VVAIQRKTGAHELHDEKLPARRQHKIDTPSPVIIRFKPGFLRGIRDQMIETGLDSERLPLGRQQPRVSGDVVPNGILQLSNARPASSTHE
jgi:hypothetical protein